MHLCGPCSSPLAAVDSDPLGFSRLAVTGRPAWGEWLDTHTKVAMPFTKLGLSGALLRAVADQGYTIPTPIQARAIPAVLAGGDLLAGAQTGTGKTAGFVLPMLQRLAAAPSASAYPARSSRKPIRALILTPTRELAAQVEESVRTYGKYTRHSSM